MPLDLDKEQAALERMTAGQLANRFAELFGELTHSRHRTHLIRKILWKLQTREAGGLSERAVQRAKELAQATTRNEELDELIDDRHQARLNADDVPAGLS